MKLEWKLLSEAPKVDRQLLLTKIISLSTNKVTIIYWSEMINGWIDYHSNSKMIIGDERNYIYIELILPGQCPYLFYPESNKSIDFMNFTYQIVEHIDNYTVPQYGDGPNDESASYTLDFIRDQIKKYLARYTSGVRGPKEQLRDDLKIAHYAQMGWKIRSKEYNKK